MQVRIHFLIMFIGTILITACETEPWYYVPGGQPKIETPAFVEPTLMEIQTETPTEEPTVVVSENLCNTPYWPISEGADWVYDSYNYISTTRVKFIIQNIASSANETTFDFVRDPGGAVKTYTCTRDGIFDERGHYMLPFTQEFQDGAIYEANGHKTTEVRLKQIDVPAGTFDVVTICWEDFYVWCFSYALGIGPVRGNFQAMDITESLVSYNLPTSPTIEQPTASFEAQVRYILADSQLSGTIDYYRDFLDQPAVDEAVRRWDSGVRVTNIDQFERKVVGEKGWQVVYIGTDTIIDGMDVRLTTDS